MSKTLQIDALGLAAVLCALLFGNSRKLCLRYNSWTTGLRTRHPHINPPPTPQMREKNTKIMTGILRFFSLWLLFLSLFLLLQTLLTR